MLFVVRCSLPLFVFGVVLVDVFDVCLTLVVCRCVVCWCCFGGCCMLHVVRGCSLLVVRGCLLLVGC